MKKLAILTVITVFLFVYASIGIAQFMFSVDLSANATGLYTDIFNITDDVYVKFLLTIECDEIYPAPFTVDVYVMKDANNWQHGTQLSGSANMILMKSIQSDANGKIQLTKLWEHKLTPGDYDIIVDANRNGVYDQFLTEEHFCYEPVDNDTGVGFTVIKPPTGSGSAEGGGGSLGGTGIGDHDWYYDPDADPYNEMLQVAVESEGEPLVGMNITLNASGTGNDKDDIVKVDIIWDKDGDGFYDTGSDKIVGTGDYASDDGTLTIDMSSGEQFYVEKDEIEYLLIAYELSSATDVGSTFSFSVTSIWMQGDDSKDDIEVSGLPIDGPVKTTIEAPAALCTVEDCSACTNATECVDVGCGWCGGTLECKDVILVKCQPGESEGKDKYCKNNCTWGTCAGTDDECYSEAGECKACGANEECEDFECVAVELCTGAISLGLELKDMAAGEVTRQLLVATTGGLSNCDGKSVEVRKDSCAGTVARTCTVSGAGCEAWADRPEPGTHTYAACIDMNGDGDFLDVGESATADIEVPAFDILMIIIIVVIVAAIAGIALWYFKMRKPKIKAPTAPLEYPTA